MTPESIKSVLKAFAVVCVAVGGFGSMLCLPFALGTDLKWITASGIYFIAGAVMITGGLATYTMLVKDVS